MDGRSLATLAPGLISALPLAVAVSDIGLRIDAGCRQPGAGVALGIALPLLLFLLLAVAAWRIGRAGGIVALLAAGLVLGGILLQRQGMIAGPLARFISEGRMTMTTDSCVTIGSGSLSARINPLGAELWSLTDAQGRELMTDADPAYWTGHAPLLFPFVGRLRGDVYRYDGRDYHQPQHGFARKRAFALVKQDGASVLFRLDADAESRKDYPFDFRLDMAFVLDGATLRMTATVSNRSTTDMPFSFGYHPAFAWPLPFGGAVEDHRITFAKPEPAPVRKVGDEPGLIALDSAPSPVIGNTLSPTYAMFAKDALIWDQLNSRSLTWGVPGQPGLKIDFPDTPWLGLWQKPGAHYLCVEPWAGMADPVGFTGTVWEKPGVIRLKPGEERSFRMDVTLVGV